MIQLGSSAYAAAGYTSLQSALTQKVSQYTVKSALRRAVRKLRANNTVHAVAIAVRKGVLR